MTAPAQRLASFKRRNFFVKQWFQVRFALYPIAFLFVFLVTAGLYLHARVRETLEFHLYLPHSRLQNTWEVVGPPVVQVAVVGAAAFLLVLGLWAWRRFSGLHADLEALAVWATPLAAGNPQGALPKLADHEVRLLGEGLQKAAQGFDAWDREVDHRIEGLRFAVEALAECAEPAAGSRLAEVRERLGAVSHALSSYRVEEDLG